jgi:putative CocE/NonD family hydrolase
MNRWFRGSTNKVFDYPVILYVMGANRWRAENAWPVPGSVVTPYYLHSLGGANSMRGDGSLSTLRPTAEPWDQYDYDPRLPAPSLHGRSLFGGRAPQNSVEERSDVLIFSTERLRSDVEITGEIRATIFAASSATDTDWHVKLVDVYPDGTAYNLTSGVIRARYRQSRTQPSPLKPYSIESYEIDLWGTSNVFKKGHKIRIEIASSDYPNFDRNPNIYGDLSGVSEKDFQIANQRIFHDDAHPSRIDLPVIPANRPRHWIPTPFPAHDATRGYVSVEEDWDLRPPTTPAGH